MRPRRQYWNDAGCDLEAKMAYIIYPGETIMVHTAYVPDKHDIPDGSVGLVFARSSLSKKGLMLANGVGVVDAGFEGEVLVALHNLTDSPVVLEEHERIAQIVIVGLEATSALYMQAPVHAGSHRGQGGFGSTGKG